MTLQTWPAYSRASVRIFPPHTPPVKIARQQGDKRVRGCDCFLATLCVSTYTVQSRFPVGIFLQKQSILVFASLPALLVVIE